MSDKVINTEFRRVFPHFAERLSAHGLETLLKNCSRVEFRSGRNIVRDKMPTDAIYFVISGDASIFVEEDERTIALGNIHSGQLLGEVSILSRQMTASSTVQANSDMVTLKLKHQPLENLLTSDDTGPVLLQLLSEILASRLRVTH
ncbi:MAG TPA: cyclic nucleotide-binding domain-containing protein [Methylotenera sp.]|nr:cyclic nucleotide-binding domain-containing protein [Methylotenera sp.]